ncbi:glycosyl hydrolase 115 family protein [Schleiferilactobacillus shenzhenensis]|uniref:Uncharacterized protein n=1 Tax=Schleiferilactobacillus shenzhenensis LY-73 TaxID=1231336 RepID=U4TK69_9LACO|nr:glycosyl hydrolase 115 family protein [Schleiferilactobacillus shenzhenensis]ERL65246.1 hypothetical protein L248_2921 [Schleiferilactobacillus shenzhenensis LY-73]
MAVNNFVITQDTTVLAQYPENPVLRHATEILQRDIDHVVTGHGQPSQIYLVLSSSSHENGDEFTIHYVNDHRVEVLAATARGVMYGALAISREILGIDDFWYFMDTPVAKKPSIAWTNFDLHLPQFQTKYRGWFVNDELLFMTWQDHASKDYVWDRIYETLLRLGGNIIVPGTDKNSHAHRPRAQEFGLTIAQHHAEPLGAPMFARVYPNLQASYLKYPQLFQKLWRDSIEAQKGTAVIYSLGFRGQGDKPFWADDPDHEWTDQEKADVINKIIQWQYDTVHEIDPGAQCACNIYGELTALFNEGLLQLPQDIIEIWADSGYGKMVSRRQGDDDPRSPILTTPNTANRLRGIYYHITFHDLQASSFLTLLPNSPAFVSSELMKVRAAHMDTLELINTGNIKPHVLFLREVALSWRADYQARSNDTILRDYIHQYYHEDHERIQKIYTDYFNAPIQYGPHSDEKAGDEFASYILRKLIKTWMGHYPQLEAMGWLTGDISADQQVEKIDQLIDTKYKAWDQLTRDTIKTYADIGSRQDQILFYNDMLLGVYTHFYSLQALKRTIQGYREYQQAHIVHAFLAADEALSAVEKILAARRDNPSRKWVDFYHNDAYTNVALDAIKLRRLRSYLRVLGDGPDEDQWERKYLMEPSDARVMLLSNTHLALSDDYIAKKLREQLIDEA